jgi:hypothetical protein
MSHGDSTQEIYPDWGKPADDDLGRDRLHDTFVTAENIAICGSFQYFDRTGRHNFVSYGLRPRKLTFRHGGRDYRLTDVHGHVVQQILA